MTVVEQVLAPVVVTERERRARVLEAAALEIEVRGWGTGPNSGLWENDGPVCVAGGICAAMHVPSLEINGERWGTDFWAAYRIWGENGDLSALWTWNDRYARDAQDVTFVLRWRAQEIRDGR